MKDIFDIAAREVNKRAPNVNIPKVLRKPLSAVLGRFLWYTATNPDLVEREFIDQVIDKTAKTFRDLNIEPVELAACTYEYLQGYRSAAYYDLPPMTEREKREEKKCVYLSPSVVDANCA